MIDKDKLRKADVFSGTLIVLLGFVIISQALKMPMKDSYAGVQNVWYVSPALFPMLVGAMITLLGLLLVRTAIKSVGKARIQQVFDYFRSPDFNEFLKAHTTIRFYGIVLTLFVFVYLLVPRIDLFLCPNLILLIFFFILY